MSNPGSVEWVLRMVAQELQMARQQHKPYNSAHEAYAVLLEEVDEFWQEVKKKRQFRSVSNARNELVQIATVAIRAIIDLNLHVANAADSQL